MCAGIGTLLLLASLPALAGRVGWCAEGEVVSVMEDGAGTAAGPGPMFARGQTTSVVAPAGHSATLDCQVLQLRDKAVSWVRSRDLQILSHAGAVFTADSRVSAVTRGHSHALRIDTLRLSDAGRYECQLNTDPKMSLFFNLTVVDEPVPEVVVSALGAAAVTGRVGSAATLSCEARYWPAPRRLPLPPLQLRWTRDHHPLTLEGSRGVGLDSVRWESRVESRLTLGALTLDDAGDYTCDAAGRTATVRLRVLTDEEMEETAEAMQSDAGAGAAASSASPRAVLPSPRAALVPLTLVTLTCTTLRAHLR